MYKEDIRPRKCGSCGKANSVVATTKEYVCMSCGVRKPRFIAPTTGTPLFLNIYIKKADTETKKFLEDLGREKTKMDPREWRPDFQFQNMFHWKNGKIVEVLTISVYTDRLAKEIGVQE